MVTDFAAQATIALEITRRERELREMQIELARANRIATMEELDCIVAEADRAGDIIHRIKDHVKKAPPKMDRFDANEAIRNAIILTRGEVVKIGASIQT